MPLCVARRYVPLVGLLHCGNNFKLNLYLYAADDLIRHWLAGVEAATSIEGEGRTLVRRGNGADGVDFLSSVDWSSGDVGQSTRHVLEGLMNKELNLCQPAVKKKSCDPLVTMEMRHKEVYVPLVILA